MAWPSFVLAVSLLGTEPDELAAEPEHEAELDPGEDEHAALPTGKRLAQRTLESLVGLDELAITLELGDDDVTIAVSTSAHHDFDATVVELELTVALLPEPELQLAWDRLHTPPLQLSTEQVERKMPSSIAVVTLVDDGEPFGRDELRPLTTTDQYEELQLPRAAPAALVVVAGYTLQTPSERDVLRILETGGPADLGALGGWANAQAIEGTQPLDAPARTRIVAAVEARLRALRAPPAFGDFQRINALTAVAYACVGPDDLERLLTLQRPVSILLSGAIVSYDEAVADENLLGVPVHGFRRIQSRSDASVQWEAATQRVRAVALDRLLRLAFDPLDFRSAPSSMRRHPTLHVAATELLAPIDTTDVGRALALAGDDPELQRGVLAFYVEVGHVPAVEPLIDWLVANPDKIESLGAAAMARMGEAMLPVLLRRFGDFEAPLAERTVARRLLAALPEQHAPALASACGSIGVELPMRAEGTTPSVAELLRAIDVADEHAKRRRVGELIERVHEHDDDRVSLRARVQAAASIGELAPERLDELADELIALHVAAARDLASDGPSGPRVVIAQLRGLPFTARAPDVARALASLEAELQVAQGDRAGALATLEHQDPELADPELRAHYVAIVERQYYELISAGEWDGASLLLDRVESLGFVELDIDERRTSISMMRRRPLIVLGVMVALGMLVLLVALLHRSGVIARMRARLVARRAARVADEPADPDPATGGLGDPSGEELAEAWANREANRDADRGPNREAGREAGREASREASREAGREADRDDDTRSPLDDFAA